MPYLRWDVYKFMNINLSTHAHMQYDSNEQRSSLLLQCLKPPINERYEEIVSAQLGSEQIARAARKDSGKKGGQAGGKDSGETRGQRINMGKQTSNKIGQGGYCRE